MAHVDTGTPPPDELSDRDRAMMGITPDHAGGENDVVPDDEPAAPSPELREEPSDDSLNTLLRDTGWDRLPHVRELYDRYDYRAPAPDVIESPEQLEIAWDEATTQRITERASEVMGAYEYRQNEGGIPPTVGLDVPVSDGVTMRVTARGSTDGLPVMELELVGTSPADETDAPDRPSGNERTIAKFFCTRTEDDTWELSHRFVDPSFRAQGIGAEMLNRMQDVVQNEARRRGAEQRIAIPARQVDVVLFGLKNGYRPTNDADWTRLRTLLADQNEQLLVTTAHGYRSDGGELPGFVYDRAHIKELRQEYWDYQVNEVGETPSEGSPDRIPLWKIFDDDAAQFIANGYTINLERRFSPDV